MSDDEKRQSPRVHTIRLVAYARLAPDTGVDQMGLGNTLDLSAGGLRMAVAQPLERGDGVDIEFALDDAIVRSRAKVVHVEEVKQYVVGLEFDGDLSPVDLERLQRFVPGKAPAGRPGRGDA